MTVLPIVARELRVSARRWGTYVLRLGAAASAIALAAIIYWFISRDGGVRPADMGKVIFAVLNGFAFLYALLVGVRVSSDCISSEKREGTLGLLFLTDLKGLDIVLGKLVASALDSFYALVSVLPVLAIPILLGSVTPGEIWRAVISLLSTALFSVCAGMFVSAFSVNERKATAGTFLLIAFIAAGIPVGFLILGSYLSLGQEFQWLFSLSPGTSMVATLVNNPTAIPWELYWTSVTFTLFYAFAFAGVAALVVPRIWQQRVEGKPGRGDWRSGAGDLAAKRAERQQLLDLSPTCWLGGRGRLRGIWLWVFLSCVMAGWLWAYVEDSSMMLTLGMSGAWMFFVHGVLKIFVASEAVRTYAEDFKQGALELILCTPLTVGEIIRGQIMNVVRYFRWPILAVLTADIFLLVAGLTGGRSADNPEIIQMFGAMMVFFVIDCAVITVVGLWQGLISRNGRQALTSTTVRIMVLPWIMFGLLNLFASVVMRSAIPGSLQLSVLIALALLINGLFGWQAWEQLHQNLRLVAASRYGGKQPSPWWAALGRTCGRLGQRRKPA